MSESGAATRRRPGVRQWSAMPLGALLLLVVAAVVALLLAPDGGGPTNGGYRTRQLEYQKQFGVDRAALLPAKLRYPGGIELDAGETVSVDVAVELEPPEPAPGDAQGTTVPAGGLLGVRLAGDREVGVDAQSPERQPVVAPGDVAAWRFAVTVAEPGERELVLSVVTYREGTDEPLATSGPYVIRVGTHATLGYRLRQAQGAVAGVLAFAGVSGGVAMAWLWRRLRRRGSPPQPEREEPVPADPAPEQAAPE